MHLQKAGGYAGLIAAGTYIFGFALLVLTLAEAGYGNDEGETFVAFVATHSGLMTLWFTVIYVINAVAVLVLTHGIAGRIVEAGPLGRLATGAGQIWAALLLAAGMLGNVAVEQVADLFQTDPERAQALWTVLSAVEEGLGGGNEIAGAVWIGLVSLTRPYGAPIPKGLAALGGLISLSGLATLAPVGEIPGAIFGLGTIVWFAWAGLWLLRQR